MNRNPTQTNRLPREIWVAGISLKGLWPVATSAQRMKDVLQRMESVYAFEPDIICLPETINLSWVNESKPLADVAEDEIVHGPIGNLLAEVARKQNCYITCPIVTKKDGRFYNSSILLDRQGKTVSVYHKAHPTATETIPETYYKGGGISPGILTPKVCSTDFGKVGLQICADADWTDGWNALHEGGAELVCFSSQGPYSNTLRNRAWVNNFAIVSSTGENAQIIDMAGDTIAADGEFARWVCAPINLEKVVLHIWPHTLKFDAIQKKFGKKIRFKIFHAENWATLESLDPTVKVLDICREYEIPTYREQIHEATAIQDKLR